MINHFYRTEDGKEVEADEAMEDGQLLDGFTMKTTFKLMDDFKITAHQLRDALDERHVVTDMFKDKRDQINRHNARIQDAWKHPVPVIDRVEAHKRGQTIPRIKDGSTPYERYDRWVSDAWRS